MKRLIIIATTIMAATINIQCMADQNGDNPLLQAKWGTLHETPPFDKIKPEHFLPAIKIQIAEARQSLEAIINNPAPATFQNTIEALEFNGAMLTRTLGVFYNLDAADTNDKLQAIAVEISPMLTEYGNDVTLNPKLFERVKQVYESRATLHLTPEESTLLDENYKNFVRNGANLNAEQKEKYRVLSTQLASLSIKFNQNELAATNSFELLVTDTAQLSGLPQAIKSAAAAQAKERSKEGYIFTLHAPSYMPFMKYADNRDLREQLWRAKTTLCATGDSTDNQSNVKEIARLRLETANLLGFMTYADYALDNRMAKSAVKVNAFLDELLAKSIEYARKDLDQVQQFAYTQGFASALQPWDFTYYDTKYVAEKYSIDDEMTRPYFQLETTEAALFMLADKLYDIKFVANKDIPVYNPDVKAYEVFDADGSFLAVLYCDYYPRAGKSSGAWMSTFRETSVEKGVETRPIVVLVNNFPKPTDGNPSLLSYSELTTMLHEFGHGLHGMFGKGSYPSQTGTNVYRDFVELPSQIMENWAGQKEFLDLFAVNYKTGEKMPEEMVKNLIAKKNHLAAYGHVRQLSLAMTDMAWHSITAPVTVSVEEFERASGGRAQVMQLVDGSIISPAFGHVFSGGYAAGYYSYKWAEVLEADAFSKFAKNGIFDKATAAAFRKNILSKGSSRDPMELYIEFAGAEPTVEPLLNKMGLK